MSIAVSAVVRPSTCLRLLLAGFGVLAFGAGLLLCSIGDPVWPLAGVSILAGLILLRTALVRADVRQIDISGVGQIRLTVYQGMRVDAAPGVLVSLAPGSTLWPGLLLLLLRTSDGKLSVLPVWPDSVGAVQFRALAVACRAIANRTNDMT